MFSAMKSREKDTFARSFLCIFRRLLSPRAAVVFLAMMLPCCAQAQSVPAEDYGPFNATFLVDGPGLSKSLPAPSPLDRRTAALLDRLGLNKQPDSRDALLAGRAEWTLAFWFKPSEPLTGAVLLPGI